MSYHRVVIISLVCWEQNGFSNVKSKCEEWTTGEMWMEKWPQRALFAKKEFLLHERGSPNKCHRAEFCLLAFSRSLKYSTTCCATSDLQMMCVSNFLSLRKRTQVS